MKIIKVLVRAGARNDAIQERAKGGFDITVKEPAEAGRANQRVIELVAAQLGVPRKAVRITAGRHSPRKTLLIRVV